MSSDVIRCQIYTCYIRKGRKIQFISNYQCVIILLKRHKGGMAYIFHNKMVYTLTVRTGGISVVTFKKYRRYMP